MTVLPLLLLQGVTPSGTAQAEPVRLDPVTIPRIEVAVEVDGELNEPAWQQAARLTGFRQFQPVDGRPAQLETEVLVWYAPDAIIFGVKAHDDPSSVRVTVSDRDNLGTNDRVTILLDTFRDQRRAFLFGVNALGNQEDGVRSEGTGNAGSLIAGNIDLSPDYVFQSKGRLTEFGYQVEIRIPFKSLRFPDGQEQSWNLQIIRNTQRTGYEDTWTDVRRANASFLAQSGTITGLYQLERGLVAEAQPFMTVTANGAVDSAGMFNREDPNPEFGVNLRLGLSAVSLDATVNPDFSQVESDVGQVTLNERFALFFPEKRPFFLEGIELFATPNQLVYTRRIVDPLVGAKISGKVGRTTIGYLTSIDERDDGNAWFNVARARQDLGEGGSTAGATLTTVDQSGRFNRVFAADSRLLFAKLYFVEGQIGASWTGDDSASAVSPIMMLQFDRTGRSWGFNYMIRGIGDQFVSRPGFVNRNDIVEAHIFNRLSFYGSEGALLENFTTFFGPTWLWDFNGFGVAPSLEGTLQANLSFRLRGGWDLTGDIQRSYVSFEPESYLGFTVDRNGVAEQYLPPGKLEGMYRGELSVSTPTFQVFNLSASTSLAEVPIFAEGSPGRELRFSGSLALRPTKSIRLDASLVSSTIWRKRDDSEFARSIIPRIRLVYQPTQALFFRVIAEYDDQRRDALRDASTGGVISIDGSATSSQDQNSLRADFLISYEPTPGTVAFFGYGNTMRSEAPGEAFSRRADGFFLKLAYQFRN